MGKKLELHHWMVYLRGQICAIFVWLKIVQLIQTWGWRFVPMDSCAIIFTYYTPYLIHSTEPIHMSKVLSYWKFSKVKKFEELVHAYYYGQVLIKGVAEFVLQEAKLEKHLSSSTLPRTWTTAISASFINYVIEWVRRQLAFIVLHKRVKGFTSKVANIVALLWFFMVILSS
jgi:hypothetical protein